MNTTHKRAHQVRPGDVLVIRGQRHAVRGVSRAMASGPGRVALIGTRRPGNPSPVWYYDDNDAVEVLDVPDVAEAVARAEHRDEIGG